MDSSIVLPASYKADADRCNASPIPAEVIAKLFPQNCYFCTKNMRKGLVISANLCNFIIRLYLQFRVHLHPKYRMVGVQICVTTYKTYSLRILNINFVLLIHMYYNTKFSNVKSYPRNCLSLGFPR